MGVFMMVRGDRAAPTKVRITQPRFRTPTWLWLAMQLGKALGRLLRVLARHWPFTLPILVLVYVWLAEDPWMFAAAVGVLVILGTAWRLAHPGSFAILSGFYMARVRWLLVYKRQWPAAMATCGLATVFAGDRYYPKICKVTRDRFGDLLKVRMLPGQHPDDWTRQAGRLAHTFGVQACTISVGRRATIVHVRLRRRDPLAAVLEPLPVPDQAEANVRSLPVAVCEDGSLYRLRLTGHVLIAGATGAGKGSVVWSIIAALGAGIRDGSVRVVALDPKGGMELAPGAPLFSPFCHGSPAEMAGLLEDLVKVMDRRADRLRGHTRQHVPSTDDPAYVVVVDELASLTAYVTDRKVKERIRESLSLLLSKGRAAGVYVVAALQDPRKEVLPFRDLFSTRIALRLTEASQADMVLGDGARDRGAVCDRIPMSTPGVGYLVLDGIAQPVRVRFPFHTDDHVHSLAASYAPAVRHLEVS